MIAAEQHAAVADPAPRRSRWLGVLADRASRSFGIAAVVAVWCILTYGGFVDRGFFPSPSDIASRLSELVQHGYLNSSLWDHIWASLKRTLSGFALAVVTAIPLGIAMGSFRWLDRNLQPILAFLRPIPPIAFIPLALLYLGLGESSKIALIFYTSFITLIVNAEAGARGVPAIYLRAARSLGLGRWRILLKIVLPAALPSIFAGLRLALAVSWAVVVAAELLAAQSGLGFMIRTSTTFFDLPTTYVGIFIIGIIGVILDSVVLAVRKRVLHWEAK